MPKPIQIPPSLNNVKIARLVTESSGVKINNQDVSAWRRDHKKYCSSKKRTAINKYFRSIGVLPPARPRPKCTCPHCGKVHSTRHPFAFRRKIEDESDPI